MDGLRCKRELLPHVTGGLQEAQGEGVDFSCTDGRHAWPQPCKTRQAPRGNRLRQGVIALLLLLVFLCATAHAADKDPWAPFDAPWFDQVTVADGLPYSITTAVAQDRDGLIWIGTMSGLVRYDGYRMQVFGTRTEDTPGLPDTYVRRLAALPDGGLLVGTNAGGLARFNPDDNTFKVYPAGDGSLVGSKIYDMADDHAGGYWIATEAGLDHINLDSGAISHVDIGTEAALPIFSIRQDRAGNLWLGSDNGLFVRQQGSDTFVREGSRNRIVGTILSNQIWALAEDRAGRIWVGSGQAGAAYRDEAGHWHGVPGFSGNEGGMRWSTVRDFLETDTGRMWLATDGSGVIEYAIGDTTTRTMMHDQAMTSSLSGNSVRALLQDRSGNIWVATELGVARNAPHARTAFSLLPSPLEPRALSDTSVHAIHVDRRGRIWLGLGGGHVDMIELDNSRMHHLRLGGRQAQRDIYSLAEGPDGSIWVGTQGLARIDPDTLEVHSSVLSALHDKPVLNLKPDDQRLLIGTYEGLYRYTPDTGEFDRITHNAGDPTSLAGNTVRRITRVDGTWWFGTAQGLSIGGDNHGEGPFENLRHVPGDPTSLPDDYIRSIYPDRKGRVWISSLGELTVLERGKDRAWRLRPVEAIRSLPSDKAIAMMGDDQGRMWISLSNGIARIDDDNGTAISLGARDGLHVTSYVNAAVARAPGGELLFGGLGGLTVIRPDWQPPSIAPATLAITGATVNGESVPFGKLPPHDATIQLDRNHHNLQLDFALLDYQAPAETRYSYRMDGLDDDWTRIPHGSLPSAIYTNLPHGQYRLRLRAVTTGMNPRTVETELDIEVSPRWYETTISQLVAALLLTGFIILLVHLRTLYLRRKATELQRQIDAHTRSLRAANQRLDELASTDDLTGVYNRRRFFELTRNQLARVGTGDTCLALFDLDRFKQINDTYGHQAGDEVIRNATAAIRQSCRQRDLIGRYGGEEFVLCLADTSLAQAQEITERIRNALAQSPVLFEGHSITATVSIGVALHRPGESIEACLSRADKALYEAKNGGRNRCVIAD